MGKGVLFTVLKSWANSWCTTVRVGESIKWKCILGCDARDSLGHYLCCHRLWSSISSHVKCGETYLDPISRVGLSMPSPERLKLLTVASRVYHSLKFDFSGEVAQALESLDFTRIHELLNELVPHYASEVGVT